MKEKTKIVSVSEGLQILTQRAPDGELAAIDGEISVDIEPLNKEEHKKLLQLGWWYDFRLGSYIFKTL